MSYTDEQLESLMRDANKRAHSGRLERLRFLLSQEDSVPAPVDALAYEYYEEARLCWYVGAFVATIVMTQLALEETLRAHYRVWKGIDGKLNDRLKMDEAGFADLIRQAEADGWLRTNEADALNKIRKEFRNPYVHTRDINANVQLAKPTAFAQYLKIHAPQFLGSGAEDEARESIKILVGLFRNISRRAWGIK